MEHTSKAKQLHLGVLATVCGFVAAYLFLDSQLRLGPWWVFPIFLSILLVLLVYARRNELHDWSHKLGLSVATVATIALISSVGILVQQLLEGSVSATNLLRDAALIWVLNVFVFSLWYWEIDAGGPGVRHSAGYTPSDFAFPQIALGPPYSKGWIPGFTDYLFVAFNTSSAFSPTDTMVLSGRIKLLMMAQSLIAIVALAVIAARAINTLN